jgi:hypothetical protein
MTDSGGDLASAEAAQHAAGAALIRDAFALSRKSGAEHWDRMTTAVLKNRILSLTNRSFDESDWGARSFRDFVGQFPDLVDVDASVRPAQVILLDPSLVADQTASIDDPQKRIRNDLWTAVLDFSSDGEYVWRDGRAVLLATGDVAQVDDVDRVPTITAERLDEWRSTFVAESVSAGLSPRILEGLQLWQSERRPDWTLPRFVRRRWNARLKRFVLEAILDWFGVRGESAPEDLVDVTPRAARPSSSERHEEVDQLRDVVVRLVRVMTREELEELRLPAAAYLRLRR